MKILFRIALILLLLGFLVPLTSQAAGPLPLRVRMVLTKVAPLQEKGEYQAAVTILAEFQGRSNGDEKEPYNHPAINFALGNCLLLQGKHQEAIKAYQRVLRRDPAYQAAWQNMASCQYETGAYKQAAKSYHRAYEISNPKSSELLYYAAATALMADDGKQAIMLFTILLKNHPGEIKPAWRETYVHALLGADKAVEALPHIEILAREYHGDKQVQWQEILLYQYLGQNMVDKALSMATTLSREAPDNKLWWKGLTHIHLSAERFDKALETLTIYSLLTPLTAEEQKLLADLNLQENVPVKAAALYEQFLTGQKDVAIIQRLVRSYLQQGRAAESLVSLDKYGKDLNDPALAVLRGDILYELKRYQDAAFVYEGVAGKEKNMGQAWLMAGYCYWQCKEYSAAERAFKNAAEDTKRKTEANRALAQLRKQH